MPKKEVRRKRKILGPACRQAGFTLIEIIIVMSVLAVLLSISIAAINPLEQFAKSRDTKRRSDIDALANAIQQYQAGHAGQLPAALTSSPTPISSSGINICAALVSEYIAALPQDPQQNEGVRIPESQCGSYDTGYEIRSTTEDHFAIEAPDAETEEEIVEIR
jgi:type IV pilus assembly protein PilA